MGRHRRLSLGLPASLETDRREPHGLLPVAQSLSRKAWQAALIALRILEKRELRRGVPLLEILLKHCLPAIHREQIGDQFAGHRQRGAVVISLFLVALVDQR